MEAEGEKEKGEEEKGENVDWWSKPPEEDTNTKMGDMGVLDTF